jgi:hypothetical protein
MTQATVSAIARPLVPSSCRADCVHALSMRPLARRIDRRSVAFCERNANWRP